MSGEAEPQRTSQPTVWTSGPCLPYDASAIPLLMLEAPASPHDADTLLPFLLLLLATLRDPAGSVTQARLPCFCYFCMRLLSVLLDLQARLPCFCFHSFCLRLPQGPACPQRLKGFTYSSCLRRRGVLKLWTSCPPEDVPWL